MTIKEYLSQAFVLDQMIRAKLVLSENLNRQALQCGLGVPSGAAEVYAKICALEAEINANIDRLVDLKRELYALIEQVSDPRERTILQLRYLSSENGKPVTWAHIARMLCYDERWVMRLHRRALESADRIWQEKLKKQAVLPNSTANTP